MAAVEHAHTSDEILRLPEVEKKVGLGHSTIYQLMNADRFPKTIPLGARNVGWSRNEIDAWIEWRKSLRASAA